MKMPRFVMIYLGTSVFLRDIAIRKYYGYWVWFCVNFVAELLLEFRHAVIKFLGTREFFEAELFDGLTIFIRNLK